jgi:hypothetical protein
MLSEEEEPGEYMFRRGPGEYASLSSRRIPLRSYRPLKKLATYKTRTSR